MTSDIKILQICSYYLGTKLYQKFFDSLGKFTNVNMSAYVFVDRNYEIQGEYPSNIYISKCYNKFERLFFHLKHSRVLSDIKRKTDIKQYDIMHAHSLFSNGYIAYKLNQEYGISYIVAVRNTDVNLFFAKILHLRNMGINILRNAEKVIFISEPYKRYTIDRFIPKELKKEIEDKSIVIPNGIDEFWMQNKSKEISIPQDKKIRLIYVGSIDDNKNIETTTKACELLLGHGYEVNYMVVGKIMNKKYDDFIKRYSFIEYIPYSQKEDLINYYRNSDIFVMPSKQETFGLVYAEAMSQGLPVIYTRGQGFDGQFEEGEVGYSVQYNSAVEIVDRVKDIISNYINISNSCLTQVDRFWWDKIAKKYLEMYTNKKPLLKDR